jgi:hypothetical protein
MLADVGSHVIEIHRLPLSPERRSQRSQQLKLMPRERPVVKHAPVEEIIHVTGVRLTEKFDLEKPRLLVIGVRKCPEDSIAASQPILPSEKAKNPISGRYAGSCSGRNAHA